MLVAGSARRILMHQSDAFLDSLHLVQVSGRSSPAYTANEPPTPGELQ